MTNKQFENLIGDLVGTVTRKTESQVKLIAQLEAQILALVSAIEALVKQTKARSEKLAKQKENEACRRNGDYWTGRIEEMNWLVERIQELLAVGVVDGNNPPKVPSRLILDAETS